MGFEYMLFDASLRDRFVEFCGATAAALTALSLSVDIRLTAFERGRA